MNDIISYLFMEHSFLCFISAVFVFCSILQKTDITAFFIYFFLDFETKFQTNRPKPTKSTVFDIYETKRINETPYSGRSHYNFNMANALNIPSLLYYISILFWLMFDV